MRAPRPTFPEESVERVVGGVRQAQRREDPHHPLQVRVERAERVPGRVLRQPTNIQGGAQHPRLKEVAIPGDKRNPSDVYEYESDEEIGPHSIGAVSVNSGSRVASGETQVQTAPL